MSLGARLLASGALGSVSGIILAAGMLALLSGPAHAQATPSGDQRQPVITQNIDTNSLLGGRSTIGVSPSSEVGPIEADRPASISPTHSKNSSTTTTTRQGNSALILNGSLNLK